MFRFVSAIHIPTFDSSTLISGGGDPVLKIWDWMTGTVKHEIEVLETAVPFIAVRTLKRKRGSDDGEAPEGGKFRRKKGSGKKQEADKELMEAGEDENVNEASGETKPEKVLVIRRIQSVNSDSGPHIVFSAVG